MKKLENSLVIIHLPELELGLESTLALKKHQSYVVLVDIYKCFEVVFYQKTPNSILPENYYMLPEQELELESAPVLPNCAR